MLRLGDRCGLLAGTSVVDDVQYGTGEPQHDVGVIGVLCLLQPSVHVNSWLFHFRLTFAFVGLSRFSIGGGGVHRAPQNWGGGLGKGLN